MPWVAAILLLLALAGGCGGEGNAAERAAEMNSNLNYSCRQVYDDVYITNFDCESQTEEGEEYLSQLCRVTYDKATKRWGGRDCP